MITPLHEAIVQRYLVELIVPESPKSSLPSDEPVGPTAELNAWFRLAFNDLPPYQFLDEAGSARKIESMKSNFDFDVDNQTATWSDPNDPLYCREVSCWSDDWHPIADLFESGVVFVDLAPGPKGRVGQVVHAWPDEMLLDVQGHSIADWLDRIRQTILSSDKLDEFMVIPQEIRRTSSVYEDA